MPVELDDSRWSVKTLDKPQALAPVGNRFSKDLAWADKPAAFSYHNLALRKDAEVLLCAGKQPLLVTRPCGSGRVTVFLGTVCGRPAAGHPGFWQWRDWSKLAAAVVLD